MLQYSATRPQPWATHSSFGAAQIQLAVRVMRAKGSHLELIADAPKVRKWPPGML
jgi:hypothetical protein